MILGLSLKLRKTHSEGRQLINGKSHDPKTIFKSILFGEAIGLRRLNQMKEDYLSSLNRLNEKAIRSNFTLDMTNDMIAMGIKLRNKATVPKMRQER